MGVLPAQLSEMTTSWRREADDIAKLVWSALAEATGEGSTVLAAVRDSADPAQQAMGSIVARFSTLADLVDRFSTDIQEKDGEIGTAIDGLSAR